MIQVLMAAVAALSGMLVTIIGFMMIMLFRRVDRLEQSERRHVTRVELEQHVDAFREDLRGAMVIFANEMERMTHRIDKHIGEGRQ